MKRYVAIDVGGTEIKYGVLDKTGKIMEKSARRTPAEEGGQAILRAVSDIVAGYQKLFEVLGVCISSMGVVDCEKGEIFYANETIPDFIGTSYKKTVEEQFEVPCEVENDVNCAGLAEYKSGAARGSRNMVCLTVGTGIGGCAVIDGKVLRGASGSTMEIGYLPVDGDEFQNLGSARSLCRKVAAQKGGSPEEWNGRRIFAAANGGDEICVAAIDEMCRVLGKGIAAICYVLNPDTVVLGGGIMAQQEYLGPRIQRALKSRLRPMTYDVLKLCFAEYQNDAGMIGVFYHFRELHKELFQG